MVDLTFNTGEPNMINAIKRILTSTILAIALAGIVAGPAMADTPPTALGGIVPGAEWLFNPSAISVTPAQGYVAIASATFTTTASNFFGIPSGWSWPTSWFIDAEAVTVFQAQGTSTLSCIVNIAIPGAVPNTGAAVQGIVTPTFAIGNLSTATSKMVGVQLYANTAYTITASIAASGAGNTGCNQIGNALVHFTLRARWAP